VSLLDEILEQENTLERVIDRNSDVAVEVADSWRATGFDHVVIAARGTSDNAARYAQYVWGGRNRLSVGLTTPSLFSVYDRPPSLEGSVVVGISQSGESPDIVSVLAEARRQRRPTLAITNDASSPLASEADNVMLLHAGLEESVAATKTYTAELAAVAVLSAALRGQPPIDAAIASLPSQIGLMIDQSHDIAQMAAEYSAIDRCSVIGRGFNHATVFEWALKLQELAYVLAQPFSTADFLHGPVALVEPGFPILAVAPSGPPHADVHALLENLVGRGARLVIISDVAKSLALTSTAIRLPVGVPEWLTPIPAIIGSQLFCYHLTEAKQLDPDRPRGLAKVTRTV